MDKLEKFIGQLDNFVSGLKTMKEGPEKQVIREKISDIEAFTVLPSIINLDTHTKQKVYDSSDISNRDINIYRAVKTGTIIELFEADNYQDYSSLLNLCINIHVIHRKIEVKEISETHGVLNQIPGCYVFYDIDGTCVYVGETHNFYQRFKTHIRGKDTNGTKTETIQDPDTGESITFHPYEYFHHYDFYQLDVYDEMETKLLEHILFYIHQPIHNMYTNAKLPNRKPELTKKYAKEYINYVKKDRGRNAWDSKLKNLIENAVWPNGND